MANNLDAFTQPQFPLEPSWFKVGGCWLSNGCYVVLCKPMAGCIFITGITVNVNRQMLSSWTPTSESKCFSDLSSPYQAARGVPASSADGATYNRRRWDCRDNENMSPHPVVLLLLPLLRSQGRLMWHTTTRESSQSMWNTNLTQTQTNAGRLLPI